MEMKKKYTVQSIEKGDGEEDERIGLMEDGKKETTLADLPPPTEQGLQRHRAFSNFNLVWFVKLVHTLTQNPESKLFHFFMNNIITLFVQGSVPLLGALIWTLGIPKAAAYSLSIFSLVLEGHGIYVRTIEFKRRK